MICLLIIVSFYSNSYHDYIIWSLICGPHNILTEQLGLHTQIVSYFSIFVSALICVKFNSCFITRNTLQLEHNLQLPGRKMFECQKSLDTDWNRVYLFSTVSRVAPSFHSVGYWPGVKWARHRVSSLTSMKTIVCYTSIPSLYPHGMVLEHNCQFIEMVCEMD